MDTVPTTSLVTDACGPSTVLTVLQKFSSPLGESVRGYIVKPSLKHLTEVVDPVGSLAKWGEVLPHVMLQLLFQTLFSGEEISPEIIFFCAGDFQRAAG